MSVEATSRAWKSNASGNELLVLLALADFAGGHDDPFDYAYPAVGTLEKMTRLSRRTVQRCLRSLEEAGEIRTTGQHQWDPKKSTTQYRIEGRQIDAPSVEGASPEVAKGRHSYDAQPVPKPTLASSLRSEDSLPTDSEIAVVSPDVEALCRVLAGEVKGNGYSVRDPLSPAWTNPMRLLLERDRDPLSGERWTPAQVRHAILWATSDEFWRLNIRSAANLRKHFEQLVARIRADSNGKRQDPDERAAVERLVAMREQMNAIREARG